MERARSLSEAALPFMGGGALLLVAVWQESVSSSDGLLLACWIGAFVLIGAGIVALLSHRFAHEATQVGLSLCLVALVALACGALAMAVTLPIGLVLYTIGIFLMPLGTLLVGVSNWGHDRTPISGTFVLMGVLAGPVAGALELLGLMPDAGWHLWAATMGMGWLAVGVLLLGHLPLSLPSGD